MKKAREVLPKEVLSSKTEHKGAEVRKLLFYNVCEPPRYDTEYFYYTEVFSDWDERD